MVETGIGTRLRNVLARVAAASASAGRAAEEVRLVAVSKTKPAEQIREAYAAGQRDFGENYVQELETKAAQLLDLDGIRWHFIGHLQTNKAKHVVELAHLVQTVDSVRIAQELGRRAATAQRALAVLIEVNVGEEASKTGASAGEARAIVQAAVDVGLIVRGLMTVPPFELEAEQTARYFERLWALREELGGAARLPELSMGMSHDFEVAIARGATMVRVGTAIFGGR